MLAVVRRALVVSGQAFHGFPAGLWQPGIGSHKPACRLYSLHQFRNPCYPYIDMGYPIPGRKVHHTGLGKPEYGLELPYRVRCPLPIDTIRGHPWDGGIHRCNHIQLLLHLAHLIPCAANGQVISGPGCRDTGYLFCCVDVDAVAVKIAEDFNGAVPLLSQGA